MAIQNDLQNAELGYILCPFESYTNINGKPLVGGWITLYEAGTDTKYISYQDWQGAFNPFKIPIPNDGRVVALGDPTKTYDAYLYNSFGDLVCSRLNLECNVAGNISIKGADTIIKNTDGTLDVSLRTLGNNVREYTVNTHNKVLDVQEPLYFVENSNTATVIGFSGDNYVQKDYLTDFVSSSISGKMDESKLEFNSHDEISAYNGSAFAGGQGDPEVNDLVHANSATWNDVSAKLDTTAFSTVSGNFLTAIPDDYATKDYVQSSVSSKLDSTAFSTVSGSFLTAHQDLSDYLTKVSADGLYYPLNSNPSGYLTAHQDLSQYAKTDDLTAYQEKGDYYSASNPSGFLTKTSADTLYQPTGDYATHDDLTAYQTVEGMTAYQPSGNYADATALDGKVDTSSFTAFSSTTNEKIEYISGALSGSYELSAGAGIDITDYPNEQKTVISVTAEGGNKEVENLVIANSATWDSVTGKADATALNDYATTAQLANKLDTTAFSTVSGSFLTAHQSLDGYATTTDVESAVSSKLDTTAFSTVSGNFLTAHQDLSDYATTAELADKLDTSAFSDVSGTFLTAHQDLSDYQTIAGMTAYQPVGSYLTADALDNVSANWNEVSAKLDTTAFSDVSGSFLTAIPDTYLQNTDLTIVDNKITEISGVELSAGTSLEFEYDAADNISAINSSAISTTPSQPLYAKSPLYAGVSGTSSFIGVDETLLGNMVSSAASARLNETVLFDSFADGQSAVNLSEPMSAFEKIKILLGNNNANDGVEWHEYEAIPEKIKNIWYCAGGGSNFYFVCLYCSANTNTNITINKEAAIIKPFGSTAVNGQDTNTGYLNCIHRVVGINRKEA